MLPIIAFQKLLLYVYYFSSAPPLLVAMNNGKYDCGKF
jgi:hypothetical protein